MKYPVGCFQDVVTCTMIMTSVGCMMGDGNSFCLHSSDNCTTETFKCYKKENCFSVECPPFYLEINHLAGFLLLLVLNIAIMFVIGIWEGEKRLINRGRIN